MSPISLSPRLPFSPSPRHPVSPSPRPSSFRFTFVDSKTDSSDKPRVRVRALMAQADERKRLGDVTLGEAKRAVVYAAATVLAVFLFVRLLGEILVALLLGVVAGAYLLPVQEWLEGRLRARSGRGPTTIWLTPIPLAATVGYGWPGM